jgi:S-DNA-T family DNA segregation ATPase FtsK/SpoIIIE
VLSQQQVSPRPSGGAGRKRGSSKAYTFPIKGLLKDYPDGEYWEIDAETRRSAAVLMETLEEFKIKAEVTGIRKGPVITMFEILPSPGVKISKIVNLADNIALRLAASRVRIVAPIPGKHAVGIEVPNKQRAIVSFKEMVSLKDFQNARMEIPVALGKDISGEAQLIDLTQTPHLLIAGATGSGKSVCVNSIICSILYRKAPEDVRILLIDPKIVELKAYNDIPHLLTPVVTEPKRAFQALQYCIDEMERRYSLLDNTGARDVRSYNKKAAKHRLTIGKIPYWVIVIDEFADLMATTGKEMEAVLARLAAMARAVGIHLVLATQRPSIDVITGLIKANIPSRIAFMVASKFDSRIIIDSVGAEKLLGQGDMLFTPAWDPIPVRIQGTYLSEEEVEAITDHARTLGEPEYLDDEMFYDEEEEEYEGSGSEDPLMDKAIEIVLAAGKASASYIQRRLKVGYNRAARMVEEMERMGIVGPSQGSKPRDIIHVPER